MDVDTHDVDVSGLQLLSQVAWSATATAEIDDKRSVVCLQQVRAFGDASLRGAKAQASPQALLYDERRSPFWSPC